MPRIRICISRNRSRNIGLQGICENNHANEILGKERLKVFERFHERGTITIAIVFRRGIVCTSKRALACSCSVLLVSFLFRIIRGNVQRIEMSLLAKKKERSEQERHDNINTEKRDTLTR